MISALDIPEMDNDLANEINFLISLHTGIPYDNLYGGSTHTHNGHYFLGSVGLCWGQLSKTENFRRSHSNPYKIGVWTSKSILKTSSVDLVTC